MFSLRAIARPAASALRARPVMVAPRMNMMAMRFASSEYERDETSAASRASFYSSRLSQSLLAALVASIFYLVIGTASVTI